MNKGEKILELGYTIEALEDEVEGLRDTILDMQRRIGALITENDEIDGLRDTIADKQRRIVELINENDRLTLTYEPYEPPKEKKVRAIKKWWK